MASLTLRIFLQDIHLFDWNGIILQRLFCSNLSLTVFYVINNGFETAHFREQCH